MSESFYLAYQADSVPTWFSLSTKPGWISKFAEAPCRAECLDEMARPWTAITATRKEMDAQVIVRTSAAFSRCGER
jgi:hypothetical protein